MFISAALFSKGCHLSGGSSLDLSGIFQQVSLSRVLVFNLSLDLSISRSLDLSISRYLDLSISRSLDLSISRPLDLSISRSLDLSISRSLDLSISLSCPESQLLGEDLMLAGSAGPPQRRMWQAAISSQ